jgi:type IV secretion system protein VirD4
MKTKKSLKQKLILFAALFAVAELAALFLCRFIFGQMAGTELTAAFFAPQRIIGDIAANEKQRLMFLAVSLIAAALPCLILFTGGDDSSAAETVKITPDIETPKAAGERQYGGARWMEERERVRAFAVYEMKTKPKGTGAISRLYRAGAGQQAEIDGYGRLHPDESAEKGDDVY